MPKAHGNLQLRSVKRVGIPVGKVPLMHLFEKLQQGLMGFKQGLSVPIPSIFRHTKYILSHYCLFFENMLRKKSH
jgi:hypothetical protein